MFALAASIHCELLQACGQAVAAYYTAVTSLLMLDIAGQGSEDSRLTEVCGLTFIALSAFGELAAQMPHDEFTDEHVPVLFSLWASRLYYYYQIADKSQQPELPHLICNAHRVLQQMIAEGIIQSPNVMLGEQPAGPQSSAVSGRYSRPQSGPVQLPLLRFYFRGVRIGHMPIRPVSPA